MRSALLLILLLPSARASEVEATELPHRLPKLTSIFPQGARPKTNLHAEILGEFLDRTSVLLFLDATISGRVLDVSPTSLEVELSVAAEASYGPHYFRVVSPRGASNLLLFRVGDLPHILESEPNSTFAEANPVSPPVTINGRMNSDGDFDFYRFHAEAGQTWIFDLRAARNGNSLDAALILLDEQARELAHNEDYFIWDPFLAYKFERGGTFTVVVQPSHAHLDPNFAYQLDIRSAPHIETVSPLSIHPGTTLEATLYGAGLLDKSAQLSFTRGGAVAAGFRGEVVAMRGSSALVKIEVPAAASPGAYELALVTPTGRSDTATFLVDPTPVYVGGGQIQPPVSIAGTARYRSPERFWFDAKKGQTLVFEVRAHRYGSPVDSILRILDDKGKQLAVNDDAEFPGVADNKDSRISHTFAADGRYQVEMRNLCRVTGENFPYELIVGPPEPRVNLMFDTDQPRVDSGSDGVLKVTAERVDGFDAPIELSVTGLPEGVTADTTVIPAGKTSAAIPLHARALEAGVYGAVRVFAKGTEQPSWRSVRISSGGGEGQTFVRVDLATLVVTEKQAFTLEADLTQVNLVRGGKVDVPVRIERSKDFAADIHFKVDGLPSGVTAEPLTVQKDVNTAKIRLNAGATAVAGRTKEIAVIGTAGGHTEEAPAITVQVD